VSASSKQRLHRETTLELDAPAGDETIPDDFEDDAIAAPESPGPSLHSPGSIQAGIEQSQPLTPVEERVLALKIRQGDKEARERFIEANLRLVAKICHRFRGNALPMEDLLMEGTIGLIEAVDRFDPERGLRFSTCAVPWIAGRLRRALQKRHLIYIPQRVSSEMHRIEQQEESLAQKLRHLPSDEELAAALETESEELGRLRALGRGPISISTPVDDGQGEILLEDAIRDDDAQDPLEQAEAGLAEKYLEETLQEVRPRDREIVRLKFGILGGRPHSYAELARRFHLTRTRVKQICDGVIERTRKRVESRQPDLRDDATRRCSDGSSE